MSGIYSRKPKFFKKLLKHFKIYSPKIKKNKRKIGMGVFFLMVFLGSIFLIRFSIFHSGYTIENVSFDREQLSVYPDIQLYQKINNKLTGENFFVLRFIKKQNILQDIQNQHPFVKDLIISFDYYGTVSVGVKFEQPDYAFFDGSSYHITKNQNFADIGTGSVLSSGVNIIKLPDYTQNLENFDGFFYKVTETELFFDYNKIKDFIGEEVVSDIKYIPGGGRSVVKMNGRNIYFNHNKDIYSQLEKYQIIKNTLEEFDELTHIDLGSGDDIIIE
ncbi:hypothetical protein [Candidatus Absconditicoccus praedator]|uniref:hypothetical protein n=1 Tax=Candidatus Absconditicoccus praedator TaxID=2735562 RepID=UPI001E411757|nr:hypothetical protein [Candidatus Absconditicoccus praedator]UFX83251.1 hypothetical protein HLG78_03930 [Candidatus Absconditicoccus praedator]